MEFGEAIDSRRCTFLVWVARSIVWFFAEDIVGGNVHQQASDFLHRYREVLGSCGVESLNQLILCRIFRSIDIGPGGTVDDYLYVVPPYIFFYGLEVGDIEVFIAFSYVGEEVCVVAAL